MANKTDSQQVTGRFMQELYEDEQGRHWADEQMVIIRRTGEYSAQVFSSGQPFQTARLHLGIITEGELDISINLQPCHLTVGALLIVTPESIMQMLGRTAKFDMQVVHVSDELIDQAFRPVSPEETVLLGQLHHHMNHFVVTLDDASRQLFRQLIDTLWHSVHSDIPHLRDGQLASLLCFALHHIRRAQATSEREIQGRAVETVNRFLHLVNEHCHEHRDLQYYADRLNLSKAHLSSIVSENSPHTAREWIEQATIARIKVMLRHGGQPLNRLAEMMSFAEPSHFSRYFKRLTGLTPAEYRNTQ